MVSNMGYTCCACGHAGEWKHVQRTTGTPDPVPLVHWHALAGPLEPAAVAQLLHVSERTQSRWWGGQQPVPWAAAELLRRLIAELPADSPAFRRR